LSQHDSSRPNPELLVQAVGAAIFASDEPVAASEIADAFGEVGIEEVEEAIRSLRDALERSGTGLRVESIAGGFRLSTRPEVGPWVRRFFRLRNRTRLSAAGLETLAIVAYRQPVTAPEIQGIRGKDSTASLKTLVDKKLIRLLGKKKVVGNPLLYGTSKQFLIHFGLDSLEDLPSIEDFDEFVEALAAEKPALFSQPDAGDETSTREITEGGDDVEPATGAGEADPDEPATDREDP
jgi:segregation and condensation protein B